MLFSDYTVTGAFILKHVSKIMVDICNNNYINISAIISLTCSKIKVPSYLHLL